MGNMKQLLESAHELVSHQLGVAKTLKSIVKILEGETVEVSSDPSSPNEQNQTDASSEVTLQALREVLGSLSVNGKTPQVKALLLKYHASNVSGVEPQYREALMAEARQIK